MATRIETDSMGPVSVPAEAYYGSQTQRAVDNFPISHWPVPPRLIHAMGRIKRAAAGANLELGLLERRVADAIASAATEVADGKLDAHFPVDVFQTGSGTSTNMNANEVIASRANELLGGARGDKSPVHPNDHVNLCQSSNDVIPTAIHLAVIDATGDQLIPSLDLLRAELARKAAEFDEVLKIGRTHLQDATPVRLGQEFGGFAAQAEYAVGRAHRVIDILRELPLGGTAVGSGLNAHPDFPNRAIARLSEEMQLPLFEARNHFEAASTRDGCVEASGCLKTIAVSLARMANDIRLMGSGPRCGLGEIRLPAVQPGSSIMPGKVNPVIAESLIQVSMWVIGADLAVTLGGLQSVLELNLAMPLIGTQLIESTELLAAGARNFARACVAGIEADRERCQSLVERSLALCTPLSPIIGYDKAAEIAHIAAREGRTVREVARERAGLTDQQLDQILDARALTEPGLHGKGGE